MTRTLRPRVSLIIALLAIAIAGCGRKYFVHPNADIRAFRTIAVLPIEGSDRAAADKVQRLLTFELLKSGAFDVVEPGFVVKVMRANRVESLQGLAPDEMKKLGQALKVDAMLYGSIIDYGETRIGQANAPLVTLQLRLVETDSGTTVWTATGTRSGASVWTRVFGFEGPSVTQATQELIREEIGSLIR